MRLRDMHDEALLARIDRKRADGLDVRAEVGELLRRWRPEVGTVVGSVQRAFGARAALDEDDVFHDAVARLLDRGLDQFRGISASGPAALLAYFLRIVKHAAIDRLRRRREQPADDSNAAGEDPPHEVERGLAHARRSQEQADAGEIYWAAFRRLEAEHPAEAAAWDLYRHQDLQDHAECAHRLGISVANSYQRVSRAQAWLRAYLLELTDES